MKNKSNILFLILLFSFGCVDIFSEKEKPIVGNTIVGNISLINSDKRNNSRYMMVLYTNNINRALLGGNYVENLVGDDSILIVKCLDYRNRHEVYYEVIHNNGLVISDIRTISLSTFSELRRNLKSKYNFSSSAPMPLKIDSPKTSFTSPQ